MKRLLISTCVVATGLFWGSVISPQATADTSTLNTNSGLTGVAAMTNSAFLPNMQGLSAMSLGGLTNCAAQDLSGGLSTLGQELTGNTSVQQTTNDLMPTVLGGNQQGLGGNNGKGCTGSDQVSTPNVQCAQGQNSNAAFNAAIASAQATELTIQCKQKSVTAVQSELNCFNNAESALAQQIGAMQTSYAQNIQRFNQDVGTYNSLIQDRQQQAAQVQQKLGSAGGNGGGSGTGLLGIQAQLTNAVNTVVPERFGHTADPGGCKLQSVRDQRRKPAHAELLYAEPDFHV
jgi:hypothetical protein